jgi:hypothetical protein
LRQIKRGNETSLLPLPTELRPGITMYASAQISSEDTHKLFSSMNNNSNHRRPQGLREDATPD